ncbi:hypothetical protein CMK18_21755 [Candidatus Poribacteria bacterium]|nr:hypothetical protein [Candidatus Poribacteria bacterium]
MADNFDELDEMTGSMSDWLSKKQQATSLTRITPAKKDKVFEKRTMVSADPKNPTVELIIELLNAGDDAKAREEANSTRFTGGEAFLHEFIDEYIKNGGQAEGKWLFVRQIQSGARGKTAPVKVELSYDKDGDLNVVEVPKSMIYAVDGRKWRKIGMNNLLPKQPVESTPDSDMNPDTSGESIASEDNPTPDMSDEDSVMDSSSTPSSPQDHAPPMPSPTDDDPLIALIGGKTVEALNQLGLRSGVKIADLEMDSFKIVNGVSGPVKLIGNDGTEMEIGQIFSGSNFGPMGLEGNFTPYTAQNMGQVLYKSFAEFINEMNTSDNREITVEQLRAIRGHMDALSRVFGFDDPNQLEAFFAAWLMKDSTCRLTGIPGTGKTTVINSAATLLANSYGFNEGKRYLARNPVMAGQEHEYLIFPSGQGYDVNYGDKNSKSVYRAWEQWRFNEWKAISATSGAYLYDFRFLQRTSDSGYAKIPMKPEDFASILFASPITDENGLNTKMIRATAMSSDKIRELFGTKGLPSMVSDRDGFAYYLNSPLYNDAGGNEGYNLREMLLEHFYDDRLDDKNDGMAQISAEMLNECGVAKIDYDKRAEEILYGIEIRQITDKQRIGGEEKEVAAYQFDPTPRKVVTQPVKFFNEANRSGSGVEDAILGLIAEKTVEYRGQTFTSPSFVAWMDTNPHQKGNDLAFVDRIDMELYFGTLTLGGRMKTLNERYGGAASKGSRPEFQLIDRMLEQDATRFITPMRFKDTNGALGLSNVWKTIIDLPFNASGAAEDEQGALLDISMISVLFTQRFMVQEKQDEIYGMPHIFKNDDDIYASPLVDISTTTNSQYEAQHQEAIDKYGSGKNGVPYQAPVLITRMLGFRFSNSLIKMTRALAFLRGKDHVTRQEVIDALPYCVGHRLGPAREGEDPKGRDIGILRDAMRLTNEQEFIRDIILNGYVLRDTTSGMGNPAGKPSLFDLWDSFLKNCMTHLDSTDAYWKYEKGVLMDIKNKVRNGGTGITPVHWSIATMIVENERRKNDYKSRYSSYLERIQRPQSKKGRGKLTPEDQQKAQLLANTSASQYFKLRGAIAGDTFLFSDDRAKLLSLVDSKIDSMCGTTLNATMNPNSANFMAIAPTEGAPYSMSGGETFASFQGKISGPNATSFKWKSYGDGMGAWGNMVTKGANIQSKIAKLGESGDSNLLDVNGADYEANQTISVTSQFVIPTKGESVINEKFDSRMRAVFNAFATHTSNGVLINEISPGVTGIAEQFNDLSEYEAKAGVFLNEWLSQTATKQAEVNANMTSGYNACFRLSHLDTGVEDAMKVKLANGRDSDIIGEDDLRLWLSLRCIQGSNSLEGGEAMISLFVGITSACMRPTRGKDGKMELDAEGNPTQWEVLPFTEDSTYNRNYYSGTPDEWAQYQYQDIGNMTKRDYRVFTRLGLKAVSDETL